MLSQRLEQKLLQKLSPQQILLMKLLQVPVIALEQRIKQEIEENPALEEVSEDTWEQTDTNEDPPEENKDVDNEEFDITDYIEEDDVPAYKYETNNQRSDFDNKEIPIASEESFLESLNKQLSELYLDEKQRKLAEHIIGSLDDAGYLSRDLSAVVNDLAFMQNIETSESELLKILKMIQELDPPGIGARDLRECLILQLKRKSPRTESVFTAITLLDKYFEEFSHKHYDKIIKKGIINEIQLKGAIDEILKLNPKPGNSLSISDKTTQYIVPDFIITNDDGKLELSLTSGNIPDLKINKIYSDMMETYSDNTLKKNYEQQKTLMFIKQKLDSAKWFIDALQQRQHTLYSTMNAIMEYQKEYFTEGDETLLKPMILKDIAEIVKLDISTISRVVNSKYVQTHFGTFLLKTFFSESLQTDKGEEVSTREVKKILSDCVKAEDKNRPVTDEQLADILKKKGYNIARRTVAKYREILGIPVARLRKEL